MCFNSSNFCILRLCNSKSGEYKEKMSKCQMSKLVWVYHIDSSPRFVRKCNNSNKWQYNFYFLILIPIYNNRTGPPVVSASLSGPVRSTLFHINIPSVRPSVRYIRPFWKSKKKKKKKKKTGVQKGFFIFWYSLRAKRIPYHTREIARSELLHLPLLHSTSPFKEVVRV